MSFRWFLAAILLAGPLLTTGAVADMGQVHVSVEGATVSESAQKAIILHNNREEVLILGTELQASRQTPIIRFIPFPSEPQVSLAPKGVFERLAELVAKYKLQYVFTYKSKGGAASQQHAGVEVRLSARLGAHDLTVIRVRDAAAFRSWVNGYFRKKRLPYSEQYRDAEAIVADYVARGVDYFVLDAVELSAEKRFVDPVVYRFATTSLYYPPRPPTALAVGAKSNSSSPRRPRFARRKRNSSRGRLRAAFTMRPVPPALTAARA